LASIISVGKGSSNQGAVQNIEHLVTQTPLLMLFNQCDPHETNLILTEAPNVFPALQTNCDQIVFEEFEFASYLSHKARASTITHIHFPRMEWILTAPLMMSANQRNAH